MSGIGLAYAGLPNWARTAFKIMGALILVAILCLTSYCQGRTDGSTAEKLNTAKAVQAQLLRDRAAQDKASAQRAVDQTANSAMTEAYHAEIAKAAPGGHPSDAAVRLACERLRRANRQPGASLPVQCGPSGGH